MKRKGITLCLALGLAVASAEAKLVLMLDQWLKRVTFCATVETMARSGAEPQMNPIEVLRPAPRDGESTRIPEMPQLLQLVPNGRYIILSRDQQWYGYRMSQTKEGDWVILSVPTKSETYEDITLPDFRELLRKHPYQPAEDRQNKPSQPIAGKPGSG